MAGVAKNLEVGILGGRITFDIRLYAYPGGPLADDDAFASNGTLPVVEIRSPDNLLIETSASPTINPPIRDNQGIYHFTHGPISLDAQISTAWKIKWLATISGHACEFEETFSIVESATADFGLAETRVGQSFGNPDLTSSHHAPNWGLLLTPDELRYMSIPGQKLTSPDANQTYDNNMLQWYIDQAITLIETDLNISLLPRYVLHQDDNDPNTGVPIERDLSTLVPAGWPANLIIRESGYPYRANNARHHMFIKLRQRPLDKITKAIFRDPLMNSILDLYPFRRERKGFEAQVQFFPTLNAVLTIPFLAGAGSTIMGMQAYNDFPDIFALDYKVGFDNVAQLPPEFRLLAYLTAGIMIMVDFGRAKSPGLASASVNLNSISESFNTTQSAENTLFGADIILYERWKKEWLGMRRKYDQNFLGVL